MFAPFVVTRIRVPTKPEHALGVAGDSGRELGHIYAAQRGEITDRVGRAVRLVRTAAERVRREERRIGLDQQLVRRHERRRLPQRACVA